MIISEKQIMKLMLHIHDYIKTLGMLKETNGLGLSESGNINLNASVHLLNTIYDQQSDELKEINHE